MTLTAPRQGVQIPGPGPDADRIRLDYRLIRIALLMVGCYAFFGLLGFAIFAGFWPPPGPDLT
ncbi:hypothetical protein [Gordonia sp. (in: high G+C Gram-positive bacteria)]|jgi:hypothetical protein|uniref:hypothetical protein n=1 Tax=Gordonia sp. (in: high G+C Gram-positive bacteria) TaxID=84139 RepID=UPI001D5BCB83|nr:hypothetical protein [Gordonia sp. (in: high G+C Gram-positive bacteria)]MCB1296621.1 hypothetical protein [Gordonia sp. (in: high G+C Gram-positive bacteria)]HMS75779.1 hypothetical protein [Gordonia sp. (in: high G+C Gram-positive bacteria)]HQV18131.1 hypothetical protein [Gordonia sp. (in: high G+C Gram-positive bacteria)]